MKHVVEKVVELVAMRNANNHCKISERDRKELLIALLELTDHEVFEDMRNTLKYYDEVYLTYENEKYEVSVGLTIKAKYAKDYIFYGEFDKSFFDYTDEELHIAREELAQCQWF